MVVWEDRRWDVAPTPPPPARDDPSLMGCCSPRLLGRVWEGGKRCNPAGDVWDMWGGGPGEDFGRVVDTVLIVLTGWWLPLAGLGEAGGDG